MCASPGSAEYLGNKLIRAEVGCVCVCVSVRVLGLCIHIPRVLTPADCGLVVHKQCHFKAESLCSNSKLRTMNL